MRREALKSAATVLGLLVVLCPGLAIADRSSENMDPAFMFEKKGEYELAAMYYQRALIGLRGVYMAFHWDGDPIKYAAGKYAKEYEQLPKNET